MAKLHSELAYMHDYGPTEAAMARYRREGEQRAFELGNRGPIRFNPDGTLDDTILEAYWRCGFYIFEGVVGADELADIEVDVLNIIDRLPLREGGKFDVHGRPALGADCSPASFYWCKPLGDPWGGTDKANGRHPTKMAEPTPPADAPKELIQLILGTLQFSEACLRVYGHPQLLAVAAQINGEDFTPFNEALFIKQPGLGGSVAWHQDGTTHWDSPRFDAGTHGFNFMAQLYGCNAINGVWVVPETHVSKVDIKALAAAAGSDRLLDAVPMICDPGDVAICNRQVLHGSFANTSDEMRVTVNFGFHRRASVVGVTSGGVHNARATYDEQRVRERSKLIGYAIDARKQKFPHETPYVYQPFAGREADCVWNDEARRSLKDYNLLDLSI